ncbi:long-chain-fatty-acid--CoA ligase [Novosphingobium sp. JCM 18896]|uniref:long-chain-fatty-acid--CoA ligase n=1 Tax=Novosphingobium sp. JCM 18896 TaxID=2989731 RepID=UPI0022228255|nr:long-chain-fatty-acid--CoA ligase [Novosphingobium sp. JCM 18896]MCW1432302.1 long-chain-fatty-acid--CoA ligase [Novosphingobium sp. JCM 18896]
MPSRPQTIEAIVRVHAAERPAAAMTTFDGETTTYGMMQTRSNRIAGALLAAGITPGDRIALIAKNCTEYFALLLGARKVGAVMVAVNWRLAPDEMAFIIEDSQARLIFVADEFAAGIASVSNRLGGVDQIIALEGVNSPYQNLQDWIAGYPDQDTHYASAADEIALQLYTSGTTGRPKGVLLSNASLFSFVRTAEAAFGDDPHEVHLNALPLFHVGGMNWSLQCFSHGAHCIAFSDFDPDEVIAEIERSGVTHLMTVPAVIKMLLDRPAVRQADLSSLRVVNYGGSTIAEKVLKDAVATMGNVFHGMYGATELSFGLTLLTPAEHVDGARPHLLRSAGRPVPGTEIRVVDPATMAEVAPGEKGEIWVKSPQRANGYWQRPEATAEIFRADGWYRSGDMGHVEDGYIYLTDRLNDMVVSGGENIYPAEVERVLLEHEAVGEAVAFGIPDARWGEAVHAVVVPVPGRSIDEETLIAFARERLARFKCPRSVSFASDLIRNPSGKVLRAKMREPYWEGWDRRIA